MKRIVRLIKGLCPCNITAISCTHCSFLPSHCYSEYWWWLLRTFLTDLRVGTAVNAAEGNSPTFMFMSLFLLTVIAEYFSATFSLSLTYFVACLTSSIPSTTESVISFRCSSDLSQENSDDVRRALVGIPLSRLLRANGNVYRITAYAVINTTKNIGWIISDTVWLLSSLLCKKEWLHLFLPRSACIHWQQHQHGAFLWSCHLNKWADYTVLVQSATYQLYREKRLFEVQ